MKVMWRVHDQGAASCGDFTADIADAKVKEVAALVRQMEYSLLRTRHQHPLEKE